MFKVSGPKYHTFKWILDPETSDILYLDPLGFVGYPRVPPKLREDVGQNPVCSLTATTIFEAVISWDLNRPGSFRVERLAQHVLEVVHA